MSTISMLGTSQAGGLEVMGGLAEVLRDRGWTPARWFYRNGASTERLIGDVPSILTGGRAAEVVLVVSGGNDSPSSEAAWGAMLDRLALAGAQRVIWVGPPAGDGEVDVTRQQVTARQQTFFANRPNVTFVDGRTSAAGLPLRDSVHLTAAGYRTWASRLASAISSPGAAAGAGSILLGLAAALAGAWWLSRR
jgi:hypothetical protein